MDGKKMAVFLMALSFIFMRAVSVSADAVDGDQDDTFISLGADLTETEKNIVLGIFGIEESDLPAHNVNTVTNQEEHQYLGEYLDRGVIGTRALSSAIVTSREEGYGIHVTTHNISYCTVGMYQNALVTAGVKDADIVVAGPFSISGTAALVGAMKSYEGLTGQALDSAQFDTANQELAVTSGLGQALDDPAQAEQLISMIKSEVIESNLDREGLAEVIDQTASEMQISLTEEDRQKILDLMDQIDDLDLDMDVLKQQVSDIYDRLQDIGLSVDKEQAKGFLTRLWERLEGFFAALF